MRPVVSSLELQLFIGQREEEIIQLRMRIVANKVLPEDIDVLS